MLQSPSPFLSAARLVGLGWCLLACGQGPSPATDPAEDPAPDIRSAELEPISELISESKPEPQAEAEASADPQLWTPIDSWKGQTVETVREFHPGGRLKRIRTRLPGVVGPDGFHGPELVYHANATLKLVKTWMKGRPDGAFKTWFPNGLVKRMGSFDQGELHGSLKEFWKIGSTALEANYEHGKLHGRVAEYFAEDKLKDQSYWIQGQQMGTHRVWSLTGTLVLEEEYQAGLLDGNYLAFYPSSGEPRIEGSYQAGKKSALWRGWTEDGSLVGEESFLAGERHGTRQAYVGGVMVEQLEFAHGVKHGEQQEFYEDGAKRAAGSMEQGLRNGAWSYWNPDGSLLNELSGTYKDDKRISD